MGTRKSLADLNEYLFQTLDALTNPELESEELERETKRAEAVVKIASVVVDAAKTSIGAMRIAEEFGIDGRAIKPMIGVSVDDFDGSNKNNRP